MRRRDFTGPIDRAADRVRDLRFALRNLARRPAFTALVVVTIACCIAANGTVFSVVRSVLLRPLSYPQPDRLVRIYNSYPHAGNPRSGNSVPDLYDRQEHVAALEAVALYTRTSYGLDAAGDGRRTGALAVTPAFLTVLRAAPAAGRDFSPEPAGSEGRPEAILGHALWRTAFRGDPRVVGETVLMDGEAFTVVGVLPESFRFPSGDAQLLTPLTFTPKQRSDAARHRDWYEMIGRLAAGATVERAQTEIDALNRARLAEYPAVLREQVTEAGFRTVVRPYLTDLTREIRRPLLLLWAGVLAVLLIGGTNVTSLFVIRARSRSREIASRVALGAKRTRIVRELVTESSLAAVAGGVLGLFLTHWSLGLLGMLEIYGIPRLDDVSVDAVVVAVSVLAAVALGAVAGTAPAIGLLGRRDFGVLQGRSGSPERGSSSLHRGLVSVQVALAFVLVMSAGLLVESLRNLIAVDPGFDPRGVSVATLVLPDDRYPDEERRLAFTLRMLEFLETVPGVRSLALADQVPFSGGAPRIPVVPEGGAPDPGDPLGAPYQTVVGPSYFEALGIELLAGRGFRSEDDRTGPRVAVIDETLARRLWPHAEPLGRHLWRGETPGGSRDPERALVVVGVVESIKQESLMAAEPAGALYLPLAQHPLGSFRLVAKLDGEPAAPWPVFRQRIASLDGGLALSAAAPLEASVAASLVLQRTPMRLLSGFALLGLFLGAMGVHGVVGCSVADRTREIGIRMAVGGTRRQVSYLVWRECLRVVGIGVALGLLGQQASTAVIRTLLYDTGTADPSVTASALGVVVAAALLACWVPVRRATRIDPASVLTTD